MPTIQVEVRQCGSTTSAADIRGHQIVVDRPKEKGGDDKGPMGGELLLVGIGGCFMSNLFAAIREREADVTNVKTGITATIAQNPARFSEIILCVSADCEDRALLQKLVTIAERGCITANTLRTDTALIVKIA
tara:strand:- start:1981 stop:2379 length:399 start_codon:yes stop_codon:yes gene_type:complete